jgi:tetratricopeptide (TPR) repeat protein
MPPTSGDDNAAVTDEAARHAAENGAAPMDDATAFRYRAFLSYSHADARWGRWLMRKLETYRVPGHLVGRETAVGRIPRRLAPIFRDRDELASAHDLDERVEQALRDSAALIVIASPASAQSRWVNEEIRLYKRLGRERHIHCFIVDGDPDGDETANCFAPALRLRIGEDGEPADSPVAPIAADARAVGDGRKRALIRLIAGLLGVGYDALHQRELARRQRRLMVVTAVSVAGMAVTLTLAGLAVLARQDAERRRVQAEGLIGFMLGDLYERLYEIGRVDIYSAVGDKATEYFASLDRDDLTDTALAQRSEALRLIGEVRAEQGELDTALQAFQLALELSMGVTGRQPDNTDWQLGLAETHYWIGFVAWQRGDLKTAAAGFEQQLRVLESVLAGGTRSAELLRDVGYAYTNLGRVEEGRGHLSTALEHYGRVLELNQEAAGLVPDDVDLRLEIGFANNNLGLLLMQMGRLDEAAAHFREDFRIKLAVVEIHPGHGLWRRYLATSQYYLGRVLEYQGEIAEAMRHYEAAIDEARRLSAESPENHPRARNYALYERRAGDLARRQGDYGQARARLERAAGILRSLRADHGDDARWLRNLADAEIALANLALETGDAPRAGRQAGAARAILDDLLAQSPDDVEITKTYVSALLAQGDAASALGDRAAARRFFDTLVADLHDRIETSHDPELLAPYVTALDRLGRVDEATPYLQRLRQMGYAGPGPALALLGAD